MRSEAGRWWSDESSWSESGHGGNYSHEGRVSQLVGQDPKWVSDLLVAIDWDFNIYFYIKGWWFFNSNVVVFFW